MNDITKSQKAELKYKDDVAEIISTLTMLRDDEGIPKNIKTKISMIITDLNESADISSKVCNSLHKLDEISEDLNIPPFIRTQIWNVSTMLENLNK